MWEPCTSRAAEPKRASFAENKDPEKIMTENDKETSDPFLAPINSDDKEPSEYDRSLTPVTKSKRSCRPPRYKIGSCSEIVKGNIEWHILTTIKSLPDWSGLDHTANRSEVPSFAPTQWR